MDLFQTSRFAKAYKKLQKKELSAVQKEISKIQQDPTLGVQKTGVLAKVKVHKFKFEKQLKLVAYVVDTGRITFIAYGSHENFYRDIERGL